MEIKVMSNAKRTNKHWSGADNEILKVLLDSGKHPTDIAGMIGRTENAVRTQMSKLGVYTKEPKVAPKIVKAGPKKIDGDRPVTAPINQSQVGLMFSEIDSIHRRTRDTNKAISGMSEFFDLSAEKLAQVSEQSNQAQTMIKASLALNAITLGVLAWIILS